MNLRWQPATEADGSENHRMHTDRKHKQPA